MSKKKYIMSGGLAFAEEQDLNKLRSLSQQGWHVQKFAFLGYSLQQGSPEDIIYSIDYRNVKDVDAEYFDLMEASGWSLVDSQGDIHLFKASPNTKPIYTDRESQVEKYKTNAKPLLLTALCLIPITSLAWFIHSQMTGTMETILFIIAVLLTVITIPATLTALSSLGNQWQVENKTGLVTFTRLLPAVFLIIAVIALFGANNRAINIIGAAVLGGIICFTVVTLFMKILHKMKNV